MTVSLTAPATRTRRRRAAVAASEVRETLRWVDPRVLRGFAVHHGAGDIDPAREQVNQVIRSSIRRHGFDSACAPLLVIDRVGMRAVLKDGNHRTNYAADVPLPRIPCRIREDHIDPRCAHRTYRGEFDQAPAV